MPTKVTRSAKPAPKPHKPNIPKRTSSVFAAAEAQKITPINTGKVQAVYVGKMGYHAWTLANYACFGALLLTAIWAGFYVHRTLALSEVGALTCSSENSLMWLQESPDSRVPELNNAVLNQCAKAYNPLG